MNSSTKSPFLLTRLRPLPTDALTQDMIDALNDPEVSGYAPGVLSVICEWIDLHKTHAFLIQVSDAKSYQLDCSSQFLSFLERLPALAGWLREVQSPVLTLDINSQGCDLRIELQRVGGCIHYACIEDQWQAANRVEGKWEIVADSLKETCKAIACEVAVVGIAACPTVAELASFREWCAKCGFDLSHHAPEQ